MSYVWGDFQRHRIDVDKGVYIDNDYYTNAVFKNVELKKRINIIKNYINTFQKNGSDTNCKKRFEDDIISFTKSLVSAYLDIQISKKDKAQPIDLKQVLKSKNDFLIKYYNERKQKLEKEYKINLDWLCDLISSQLCCMCKYESVKKGCYNKCDFAMTYYTEYSIVTIEFIKNNNTFYIRINPDIHDDLCLWRSQVNSQTKLRLEINKRVRHYNAFLKLLDNKKIITIENSASKNNIILQKGFWGDISIISFYKDKFNTSINLEKDTVFEKYAVNKFFDEIVEIKKEEEFNKNQKREHDKQF